MDLGLKGKRALVCGASQGMGLAIAQALAKEGADVFMCARSEEKLKQARDLITESASGGQIETFACDLSSRESTNKLIDAVKAAFGGIDVLVHNTGGPKPSPAEETSLEQWESGFHSLFESVVQLNDAFLPGMKTQQWGRILCVTSLSVVEPIGGLAISNAMRSAVTAMLKTLADEVARFGITINCIAPGSIATGRIEELIEARSKKANVSYDEYHADYVKAIPAGRLGTPEEFAAVACFLASTQASYVTGSTVCVDGGRRRSTY